MKKLIEELIMKEIEVRKEIIAKERDEIRDLFNELEDLLSTLDDGIEHIEIGLDDIRSGIESISETL